jgi:hypothetical protein
VDNLHRHPDFDPVKRNTSQGALPTQKTPEAVTDLGLQQPLLDDLAF